jgi:hypothetical protein
VRRNRPKLGEITLRKRTWPFVPLSGLRVVFEQRLVGRCWPCEGGGDQSWATARTQTEATPSARCIA